MDRRQLNKFTPKVPGNSRDPRLHMKVQPNFLLHILSWESPGITEKIQLLQKDENSTEKEKDKEEKIRVVFTFKKGRPMRARKDLFEGEETTMNPKKEMQPFETQVKVDKDLQ